MPHNKIMKKTILRKVLVSAVMIIAVAVLGGALSETPLVHAAGSNIKLTGYAWSSDLGWIHFEGTNYGVVEDASTGSLSGYAWSSNLGWVNFSDGTVSSSGTLTGYAQACSAYVTGCSGALDTNAGGWDGKISLSGTAADGSTYAVQQETSCDLTGYAWGSDSIGAVNFNGTSADGSTYGVSVYDSSLTASLSASPTTVSAGETSTLTWSSTGTASCTIDNGVDTKGATSGSVSVTPVTTTTYTLTCLSSSTLNGGCTPKVTDTATVTVGSGFSCTQTGSNFTATPNVGPYSWTVDGATVANTTDTEPIPTSVGSHSATVKNSSGTLAYCPVVTVGASSCVVNITGTINALPNRIASNTDPVVIAWSVQGYDTLADFVAAGCEIDKNGATLKTLDDASVDSCNAAGTYTDTSGVTKQTTYSVRCTNGNNNGDLAKVIVNVEAQFNEF